MIDNFLSIQNARFYADEKPTFGEMGVLVSAMKKMIPQDDSKKVKKFSERTFCL